MNELPDGFVLTDKPSELWRVGFVYRWSEVFESWLDCCQLVSIRPEETVAESYLREFDRIAKLDDVTILTTEG